MNHIKRLIFSLMKTINLEYVLGIFLGWSDLMLGLNGTY